MSQNDSISSGESISGSTSSNTFKTAVISTPPALPQQTKPPEAVTVGITKTPANPILSEYKEANGHPYAQEYFETGTPYDFLPSQTQQQLGDIDQYVEKEMTERGLKPNLSNYHRIVQELKFELGGLEDLSVAEEIERIAGFAKNMIKLDGVEDIRQELKQKLKRMKSTKQMSDAVLKAIGKKIL